MYNLYNQKSYGNIKDSMNDYFEPYVQVLGRSRLVDDFSTALIVTTFFRM